MALWEKPEEMYRLSNQNNQNPQQQIMKKIEINCSLCQWTDPLKNRIHIMIFKNLFKKDEEITINYFSILSSVYFNNWKKTAD